MMACDDSSLYNASPVPGLFFMNISYPSTSCSAAGRSDRISSLKWPLPEKLLPLPNLSATFL